MNIDVQWDNPEQTIVYWYFKGHWEWKEFLAAQQQTIDLMKSVPQTVHVIVDVSQSQILPSGALGQFHTYRRNETPNAGRVVIVGMNAILKSAITMFQRIFPSDWGTVLFANTSDEARKLLNEM